MLATKIAGWPNIDQFHAAERLLLDGGQQGQQGDRWPADGAPGEDGWTAARKGFRDIAFQYGYVLPPAAQKDACKRQEVGLIEELTGPLPKLQPSGWPFADAYERAAGAIIEIANRQEDAPQDDFDSADAGPFGE